MALMQEDRRWVGWLGGLLLAAGSWVRLADLGVHAPEPYTLPAAVALLGLGVLRLRRDERAGTLRALTPGLTLALVPSLLWVLDDPLTARALVLGLVCVVLVIAGVQARWSAPLLGGALAGAVLVVREAAPYVGAAVPRWGLIGTAGLLLIVLGVTWEQRLQEARKVSGRLRVLR
jgi:cell division protein FtsW (lipid II flippase)